MLVGERMEFRAVIDRLGLVFGRELGDELLDVYWQALRDLPLGTLKARADAHIRTGKFFPKPRDLRANPDAERVAHNTFTPPPIPDGWGALMNRVMFRVLLKRGKERRPVDDARLPDMIAYKNRIAAQMEAGGVSDEEWKEIVPGVEAELERLAA